MEMKGARKNVKTKKWNVSLRVSPEEEQKIKIGAIKMGMGVANYIKQAALEKIPTNKPENSRDIG